MAKFKVRVAASYGGRTADLFQVSRYRKSFVIVVLDALREHYTWRDGERSHLSANPGHDLSDTRMDHELVEAIRDHYGTAKRWMPGWESGKWADEAAVNRTHSRAFHADRLDAFPDASDRGERLTWELGRDDGLEAVHYLCRPGSSTDKFLSAWDADPEVKVWRCERWEPWSVVTATRRRGATIRGRETA